MRPAAWMTLPPWVNSMTFVNVIAVEPKSSPAAAPMLCSSPQLAQRSDESRSWHFQQITASCPAAQTEKDSPQLQEPEAMGFLNSKPVFIRPFL